MSNPGWGLEKMTSTKVSKHFGTEVVIFSEEKKAFSWEFPEHSYWTPTVKDVEEAESKIEAMLKKEAPQLLQKLSTYKRQYVGLSFKGKKFMFVNFFCTIHHEKLAPHWNEREVDVMDGGDCFFQLKYDVNQKEGFDLRINGEA